MFFFGIVSAQKSITFEWVNLFLSFFFQIVAKKCSYQKPLQKFQNTYSLMKKKPPKSELEENFIYRTRSFRSVNISLSKFVLTWYLNEVMSGSDEIKSIFIRSAF